MKSKVELDNILKKEKTRRRKIKMFLKKHEGFYFTDEDVVEAVGIKCAGRILREFAVLEYKLYEVVNSGDPKRKHLLGFERIDIPLKPEDDWCGEERYYGYRNDLPKELRDNKKVGVVFK